MKAISIDFKNKRVCIMIEGQQGTEVIPNVVKDTFTDYIPKQFRDYSSFTWNFEENLFSVNEDFDLREDAIITKENFSPKIILSMPELSEKYKEFIGLLGYEEVDTSDFLMALEEIILRGLK